MWKTILVILSIIILLTIPLAVTILIESKLKRNGNQSSIYWVIDLENNQLRVCYFHHRKRNHIYVRIPSVDNKVKEITWDDDYNNWLFTEQLKLRDPNIIGRNTTKITTQDQVKHDDKKS